MSKEPKTRERWQLWIMLKERKIRKRWEKWAMLKEPKTWKRGQLWAMLKEPKTRKRWQKWAMLKGYGGHFCWSMELYGTFKWEIAHARVRVPYTVLHYSTTRFQFDLTAMHPSHALSSIVLQSSLHVWVELQ
jgi:hypothetical protein